VNEAQAAYAIARARVEVRLAELREALVRHEVARRWNEHMALDRVERGLAALAEEVPCGI
jgi:hypothetical protein